MSGIYTAYRTNGGPTQHPANPTAVTADVLEAGFIFAFASLGLCYLLILPGYRKETRIYFGVRVFLSLFIGGAIFLGVLGQEWEIAEIHTKTPYKAFTNTEIEAEIGMKIGLAAVNITLKGTPVVQEVAHTESMTFHETINYNERFHWHWRQGRFGFGPFAGRINREFRAAQFRGLPLPILWIAEYFTLDGESIRWGRSYRSAGWYTNEVLWTAVPLWLIANILAGMVLVYSGILYIMTGVFMLMSTVIWASIKWGAQPMVIPFEDARLETHYGPSFWLVVSGGIVSFLYGLVIIGMDFWYPQQIADFFGNDVLQDSEDYFHQSQQKAKEEEEQKKMAQKSINKLQSAFNQSRQTAASRRRKPTRKPEINITNVQQNENATLAVPTTIIEVEDTSL